MTTLVTGAAGFFGQQMVRRYLEIGRTVTALDSSEERLRGISEKGVRVIARDLKTRFTKEEVADLKNIRTIIHAASVSSPFSLLPKPVLADLNLETTRTLIQLAEDVGAARFVFISTPQVYTCLEDQYLLHETTPLPPPLGALAQMKTQAEQEILTRLGRGTVVLRPQCVYGPGDPLLVPALLDLVRSGSVPLFRGGAAETDFTHVEDLVDAVLAAERTRSAAARIFNISGGNPLQVKRFIDRIAAASGLEPRWRKAALPAAKSAVRIAEARSAITGHKSPPRLTRSLLAFLAFSQTHDISRAKAHLGWTPRHGIDEGLDALASWIAADGAGAGAEGVRQS